MPGRYRCAARSEVRHPSSRCPSGEGRAMNDGNELITDEWLAEVGFKWHQLERQPYKHWLLWLGDAIKDSENLKSSEDLGIEVTQRGEYDESYYCWLRADYAGRYSRFIFVRYLR